MLDDKEQSDKSTVAKEVSDQAAMLLTGVDRTVAVACDSIMEKMRQLEEKIQSMEDRYTVLARDAQKAIQEAEKSLSAVDGPGGTPDKAQQS